MDLEAPTVEEQQVTITVELPEGAGVTSADLRLVSGIRDAELTPDGRRGGANVSLESAQLVAAVSPEQTPILLGLTTGQETDLTLSASSTATAIAFLTPALATADADSARRILSAIRADESFDDLTEIVVERLRSGNGSFLTEEDPSVEDLVTEIVERVVDAVGSPRSSLVEHQNALVPEFEGTDQGSGLVADLLADPDGSGEAGIRIQNRRRRWVSVVVSYGQGGGGFESPESENGPWYFPTHFLPSAGLTDLATGSGPTTEVPLTQGYSHYRVKAFGIGAGSVSEALGDEDSEYLWYPVTGHVVFNMAVPIVEVVTGVKGLGVLPVWQGTGSAGQRWIGATIDCVGRTSTVLGVLGAALENRDWVELATPIGKCSLLSLIQNVDILTEMLAAVGVAGIGTAVASTAVLPLKIFFIAKTGAEIVASSVAITSSDALFVFELKEEDAKATLYGAVRNLQTFEPIPNATLALENLDAGGAHTVSVDSEGSYRIDELIPGTYRLEATSPDHKTNTADNVRIVDLEDGDIVRVDFALPPEGFSNPVANVSGQVTDEDGNALGGAFVGISGRDQTNGIFRSTQSASDGTYSLTGVTLVDDEGQPIPEFDVLADKSGYAPVIHRGVELEDGETVTNLDFSLPPASSAEVFFEDGFESGLSWEASGFWNRTSGSGIQNEALPTYVSLAPDDPSDGFLPGPFEGNRYVWYGAPSDGNFMGTQISGDTENSGGTSTEPNSGFLLSPSFTIPSSAAAASLQFGTWFEIESVNPNDQGYDLMVVGIVDEETGEASALGLLNPQVDPELDDREHLPFTSGGFNRNPVFRPVSMSLDSFIGKPVRLLFIFDTVDPLYNGFRGWVIDDVKVVESTAGSANALRVQQDSPVLGHLCGLRICEANLAGSRRAPKR